jgi:hypothetical protein
MFSESPAKKAAKDCAICNAHFGLSKWKHSCKSCDKIICSGCSVHKLLPKEGEEEQLTLQRLCTTCLTASETVLEPVAEEVARKSSDPSAAKLSANGDDETLDEDGYDGYESTEEKPKKCCGCC